MIRVGPADDGHSNAWLACSRPRCRPSRPPTRQDLGPVVVVPPPRPPGAAGRGHVQVAAARQLPAPVEQSATAPRTTCEHAHSPHQATTPRSPFPATPPTPRWMVDPGDPSGPRQGLASSRRRCRRRCRAFDLLGRRAGLAAIDRGTEVPARRASWATESQGGPDIQRQAAAVLVQPSNRPPGKARPATRAISSTSSLLRASSTTRKPPDGSSSRRSHPSAAAPGRLVTNSSTRSSRTRRTTVSSAWRDSRSAPCKSSTTAATGPPASVSNATRSSPAASALPPPSMPSCSSTANG